MENTEKKTVSSCVKNDDILPDSSESLTERTVVLCVGMGDGVGPVMSRLEDMGMDNVSFADLMWEYDSIEDCPGIFLLDGYGLDGCMEYDVDEYGAVYGMSFPQISVFMIDLAEDVDTDKAIRFMNEVRVAFPYAGTVLMAVVPSGGNRAEAIGKCKVLSEVCDTVFAVDEKRISGKYPGCDGKALHRKALSFMALQFREFAEMMLDVGTINVGWDNVLYFTDSAVSGCKDAMFFTASGNDPDEVIGRLTEEMSCHDLVEDDAIVDIVLSHDSGIGLSPCLLDRMTDSARNLVHFIGIRKSESLKENNLRVNVFVHGK